MGIWFLCAIEVQTHSCKAMDVICVNSLQQKTYEPVDTRRYLNSFFHPFTTALSWKYSKRAALTHCCVVLTLFLAQSISTSVFALGFMNVKMVHSCHSRWLTRPAFWPLTQWKQPWGCPFSTQGPLAESPSHGRSASLGKISPQYLQGELSWRIPCSLSQGLSSSPAGLALITYAHNPWLVHVIHQPRPRPLAPESPQLTCLLGGSRVAMATLIFSWQLGFSHGAKSLFSLCVSLFCLSS